MWCAAHPLRAALSGVHEAPHDPATDPCRTKFIFLPLIRVHRPWLTKQIFDLEPGYFRGTRSTSHYSTNVVRRPLDAVGLGQKYRRHSLTRRLRPDAVGLDASLFSGASLGLNTIGLAFVIGVG
jgi:hypothetical protein